MIMAERVEPPTVAVWVTFRRQFARVSPELKDDDGNPSRIIRRHRLPRLPAQPDGARGLVGVIRCAACRFTRQPVCNLSSALRHSAVGLSDSTYAPQMTL